MNSRLNVSLRERRGLVYNVESNLTSYTDTGFSALILVAILMMWILVCVW